jgi:hypothetical protein
LLLSKLPPPVSFPEFQRRTFMEYQDSYLSIQLLGRGGSFSHIRRHRFGVSFRRVHPAPTQQRSRTLPQMLLSIGPREVLSVVFPFSRSTRYRRWYPLNIPLPRVTGPPSPPLPKTLLLLDCVINEDLMFHMTRVARYRENNGPRVPHRVVITNSRGRFSSAASIERLGESVPVVEVLEGSGSPEVVELSPRVKRLNPPSASFDMLTTSAGLRPTGSAASRRSPLDIEKEPLLCVAKSIVVSEQVGLRVRNIRYRTTSSMRLTPGALTCIREGHHEDLP